MVRLTWLLAGLALAVYGFGLIADAETLLPYILRDGLLVGLAGAIVFAVHAGALPVLNSAPRARGWSATAQLLFGVAVACSLAAAAVLALLGAQGWPSWLAGALWALALILWLGSLLWPGETGYSPPAYRWSLDAAGRYVRMALGGAPEDAPAPPRRLSLSFGVAVLLVIAGGWALRLWRIGQMPPTCVDLECALALRLVDGAWWTGLDTASTGLYTLLSAALYRLLDDGVAALRWASVIFGCLTLPLFYWGARSYARPAGALLGLLLLALSPWHIWASRSAGPWIVVPLLLVVALGTAGRSAQGSGVRWHAATGAVLGLLLAQPAGPRSATLIWILALAVLIAWREPAATRRPRVALLLGSFVVIGAPLALPAWLAPLPAAGAGDLPAWPAALLHRGALPLAHFLEHPLWSPWQAALALSGLAVLLRAWRQPPALVAASGVLVYAAGLVAIALTTDPLQTAPARSLLAVLPWLALAAAVALDQTVAVFDQVWARLIPLSRTVAVALALLLLLAGRNALQVTTQLRTAARPGQNAAEIAMGQYLAACLSGQLTDAPCVPQGEFAPIFYVPPGVVEHPATRLLVGAELDRGRIRTFDAARDLLPTVLPTGDQVFLVALDNQPLIELLQQIHPEAATYTPPPDQAGPTQFLVYTVPYTDVLARRGLLGRYMPGLTETPDAELRQDGPLAFDWSSEAPMNAPFNVVWDGSLIVPEAGAYLFQAEGITPGAADPVVSMQVDGQLVLDTSLGLVEQHMTLAQGAYRLGLRYRTNAPPADWAILWQPPTGSLEPIPRAALVSPALPNIGLLGAYYADSQWQGPALTMRKDLILGDAVDLPAPYSVRWQGKLAAPRAGEYLFAVTADGPLQLQIDGAPVLDHLPATDLIEGPGFSQASVYLDVGWHDIDLRYAPPAAEPDLRVLWQPPGSSPMLLLSRYLLPLTGEIAAGDLPLPPAPDLLDARLGSGLFALSASMDLYQPDLAQPPSNLPPLLAEQVWQVGAGCGAGAGQFDRPHGLALDANAGTLYVADTGNRRVLELDLASGNVTYVFAAPEFQEPVDVELGPDGSLLALDALVPAIYRIDRATGEIAPIVLETGFYRPRGFGIDESGNLAVADTGGARVVLLDPAGSVLAPFGGPQTLLGQGQPVDALATGGALWTVTAENGRLWRLDVLGSLVAIARGNTLDGPQLAALPDGAFFLSDPTRRSVLALAATGQPIAQLAYPEQFLTPTGVAAGVREDKTYLAVADSAACTVSLWRVRLPAP